MTFDQIKKQEADFLMPTYARFPVALESGHGAVAVGVDGREYIDFGSGIGVNSLGYCDSGWAQAVARQAAKLQHISNLYYSPVQTQFAQTLCEAAGFSKAFLCNSGAEANECAIKLARKYSFDTYGPGRHNIISLENSFHGRTITTLSATGQDSFHNYFFPFTDGFRFAKAGDLESLFGVLDNTVCAVMLEAVQGEGGVVPLDSAYVSAVADLCQKFDLLLIFDEVQTGIGRTGKLYASEHFGVKPDILTSAKGLGGGLPIGACLCNEKTANVLSAGHHGTTFGGNPVVCAGAQYVLEHVNHPDFLGEVAKKGDYLKKRLQAMPGVKEVRGLGMMLGVALEDENGRAAAEKCLEKGLIILTAKTLLRLLPPLTISDDEIDRGLAILEAVFSEKL